MASRTPPFGRFQRALICRGVRVHSFQISTARGWGFYPFANVACVDTYALTEAKAEACSALATTRASREQSPSSMACCYVTTRAASSLYVPETDWTYLSMILAICCLVAAGVNWACKDAKSPETA